MDSAEDARWAADNNDIDLRLKEDTINKLSLDRYREFLPKDKGINALFASYCAVIMRDFLDQIRAKTYSDEHIFVSEKDLQASAKRSLKIMLEEDSPKAMNEKLRDHREQFRNYTLKVNMQDRRNYQMKGIIERSEKNFMILLVELFPGKAGEIRKYIKMAGYTVPEIRDLVDRTVGREPRTEFLYKGLSKSR